MLWLWAPASPVFCLQLDSNQWPFARMQTSTPRRFSFLQDSKKQPGATNHLHVSD